MEADARLEHPFLLHVPLLCLDSDGFPLQDKLMTHNKMHALLGSTLPLLTLMACSTGTVKLGDDKYTDSGTDEEGLCEFRGDYDADGYPHNDADSDGDSISDEEGLPVTWAAWTGAAGVTGEVVAEIGVSTTDPKSNTQK